VCSSTELSLCSKSITAALPPVGDLTRIVEDAVKAAVGTALSAQRKELALLDRMNPFARSHHSDSISLHSAAGAQRFPGNERERKAFKERVAGFYGLQSRVPGFMTNMLGAFSREDRVTLAHIWPASYTNWADAERELSLPPEFYKEPRNFLLLPEDVHVAFDHGRIVFVPAATHITCFVLPGAAVNKRIRKLHGRRLYLPRHDVGGVPYKRQLAFFALQAKGQAVVEQGVQAALDDALSASADASGNAAVHALEERMRAIQRI
jgi:hypothetical protein